MTTEKFTVASFQEAKTNKRPICVLTAYDFTTARILDGTGIDALLVGDSLGMVMLGYADTLKVTMEEMLHHTRAVVRGTEQALVIGDMPFMSYHITPEQAVQNAGRFIQEGGAQAVKLEGGRDVIAQVRAIVKAQIPLVGHLGLTPQSVNAFGGFKVQGKDLESATNIIEDALRLQDAGAFAIVLECVPDRLAALISQKLEIPTIGIGAGSQCDGQVLVIHDLLGLFRAFRPKFVKAYASQAEQANAAVRQYIEEVRDGRFPQASHSFPMDAEVAKQLMDTIDTPKKK